MKKTGFVLFLALFASSVSVALPDPSTAYCSQLGYVFYLEHTAEGERGMCRFPDGSVAGSWPFLRGEEKQEYNYCAKKGYKYKVVEDSSRCTGIIYNDGIHAPKCVVCVLKNNSEIEVLSLIGREEYCKNCSSAPPAGKEKDNAPGGLFYLLAAIILTVSFLLVVIILKRKRRSNI
jgi:putative hemolysin